MAWKAILTVKARRYLQAKSAKVTSDLCTIVDDCTLKDLRGSHKVDDEG